MRAWRPCAGTVTLAHVALAALAGLVASPGEAEGASVTWTGSTDANWDTTTPNWSDGGATTYSDGDDCTFDDTPGADQTVTVQAGGVAPGSLTFANATYYVYLDGGPITVNGLTKSGAAEVRFMMPNAITGAAQVDSGTLAIFRYPISLGTAEVVLNGGNLAVYGNNWGDYSTTFMNDVTVNANATIHLNKSDGQDNGVNHLQAFTIGDHTLTVTSSNGQNLAFDGTTTLVGSPTFDVADDMRLLGPISGNAYSITKTGNGSLLLGDAGSWTGDLHLAGGTVAFVTNEQTHSNTIHVDANGANLAARASSILTGQIIAGANSLDINTGSTQALIIDPAATVTGSGGMRLEGGLLHVPDMSYLFTGNLNLVGDANANRNAAFLLDGSGATAPSLADFLARAEGTGAGEWQMPSRAGGFAARGTPVTLAGEIDYNRDMYLGSRAALGGELYADQPITVTQDVTFAPGTVRVWGFAGQNAVALNASNDYVRWSVDGPVHEIAGVISDGAGTGNSVWFGGGNGTVRVSNAANDLDGTAFMVGWSRDKIGVTELQSFTWGSLGTAVIVPDDGCFGNATAVWVIGGTNGGNGNEGALLLFEDQAGTGKTFDRDFSLSCRHPDPVPGFGSWAGDVTYTGSVTMETRGYTNRYLVVYTHGSSTFAFGDGSNQMTITDNYSDAGIHTYYKEGAGTLVLVDHAVTLTVGSGYRWVVYEGAIRETAATPQSSTGGVPLVLDGGVVESNDTVYAAGWSRPIGTAAGEVSWGSAGGGFAAVGGDLVVDLGAPGPDTLTWPFGAALVFGSPDADGTVQLVDNIYLGGGTREVSVIAGAGTFPEGRISGVISGDGDLVKTGGGTLELAPGVTHTYDGTTIVREGTLLVNGTVTSQTLVALRGDGTLGGSGSIGGPVTCDRYSGPDPAIAWWKLDDGADFTASDSSAGTAHDGTLTNMAGTEWTAGYDAGALAFDGIDDYVEVPHHDELVIPGEGDPSGVFSLSLWVRWHPSTNDGAFIMKKGAPDAAPGNWCLKTDDGVRDVGFFWSNVGTKGVWAGGGTDVAAASDDVLKADDWSFVAVAVDGTHATDPWVKVYVDGALRAQYFMRTDRRPGRDNVTDPLYIGGAAGIYSFGGSLDDIRIYDRLLGPVEVEDMLLAGAPTAGGGLAPGSYDDPGTAAVDERLGTLTTGPLTLVDGTSLAFDFAAPGTCDVVQVQGALVLDGTLTITDVGGLSNGTYTIMTYTPGMLTDNGLVVSPLPDPFAGVVDLSVDGEVRIVIVGALVEVSAVNPDGDIDETGADTTADVVLFRDDLTDPLDVHFTISGSALGGGTDYALTAEAGATLTEDSPGDWTVRFPASSATVALTVTAADDTVFEHDETVTLELYTYAGSGYGLTGTTQATVTIHDTDPLTASITATDAEAMESSADAGEFTITLAGSTGSVTELAVDVTVNFEVDAGSTASAGTHYVAISPTNVTVPAGTVLTGTVPVAPVDNGLSEGDVYLTLNLVAGTDYAVAGAPGDSDTVTIHDDDVPTATISVADGVASEPGGPDGTAELTVTLDGVWFAPIDVSFSVSGDAGRDAPDDYDLSGEGVVEPGGTSITIPAGQLSRALTVTAVDDTEGEPDETVAVTLEVGSGYKLGAAATRTASVTIRDDEPRALVTASADTIEGGSPGEFTVELVDAFTGLPFVPAGTVDVAYTVSGTATPGAAAGGGSDYETLAGTVAVTNPSSSAVVYVNPFEDEAGEGTETVTITLTGTDGYYVGVPSAAVVNVEDSEATVTIAATVPTATEEDGVAVFTVTRDLTDISDLVVEYAVGGSAVAGEDYLDTLTGTVQFAGNAAEATIEVEAVDNMSLTGDRTVVVTLTARADELYYAVGAPASATVVIEDDERPGIAGGTGGCAPPRGGSPGAGPLAASPPGGFLAALALYTLWAIRGIRPARWTRSSRARPR